MTSLPFLSLRAIQMMRPRLENIPTPHQDIISNKKIFSIGGITRGLLLSYIDTFLSIFSKNNLWVKEMEKIPIRVGLRGAPFFNPIFCCSSFSSSA